MKKVIVISTSLRKGSNSDMLADKFTLCGYDLTMHHHALADAEACARIAMEIYKPTYPF